MPSVNLGRVSIVPKGAWSNSNSYEKLDVVTYGGGSYIANKDVPAGTSLSTTEYWSNFVGSFNIGTVETVSASTGASAELVTTSTGQTLNLQIPRGVAGNESIDDSKGDGDTDYVWSANKSWNEVNNLDIDINGKANAIEKTVLGDIVSFDDGADNQYVKSLKVSIEPQQDLHGYDHPWPAGGGVNKFPNIATQTLSGITLTNNNGVITLNGTATDVCRFDVPLSAPIAQGETIRLTLFNADVISGVGVFVGNDGFSDFSQLNPSSANASQTFSSISYTATTARIRIISGTTISNKTLSPMLTIGSEAQTAFSPYSNICPITGLGAVNVTRTGVNVWDEEWDNGSINQNTGEDAIGTYVRSKNLIPVPDNTNVYLKCGAGNYTVWVYAYDKGGQFVKTAFSNYGYKTTTFNLAAGLNIPSGIGYIRFLVDKASYGTTYKNDISINYPATDTQYHAGHVQQVTIDLDGTRYGGTLDVTNGKMMINRAYVDGGNLNWTYWTGDIFYTQIVGKTAITLNDVLCSCYESFGPTAAGHPSRCIGSSMQANSKSNIYLCDPSFTHDASGASALKTAMTGQDIVYYLSQPFEVTLTPQQLSTLLGENHIWADSGDIEVTYRTEIPALEWGNISGTLSDQTDLQTVLDTKADKTEVDELDSTIYGSETIYTEKTLANICTKYAGYNFTTGTYDSKPAITGEPNASFDSYAIWVQQNTKVYVDASDITYYAICIGTDPETDNFIEISTSRIVNVASATRLRKSDNNLPTPASPLTVSAGTVLVFTVTAGTTPTAFFEKSVQVVKLGKVTAKVEAEKVTLIGENYATEFTKKSTTQGYQWNITSLSGKSGENMFPTGVDIVGVIQFVGGSNFMGGAHGNESNYLFRVLKDGSDVTGVVSAEEIHIVMDSHLYDPDNTSANVVDRFVEFVFTSKGWTCRNTFKILTTAQVQIAYPSGLFAFTASDCNGAYSNVGAVDLTSTTARQLENTKFREITINLPADFTLNLSSDTGDKGFVAYRSNTQSFKVYFANGELQNVVSGDIITGKCEYRF